MLKAINLGQQLTKKEMKEVKGGGSCCWHNNVTGAYVCGLTKAEAIAANDNNNPVDKWCCSSCPKFQ